MLCSGCFGLRNVAVISVSDEHPLRDLQHQQERFRHLRHLYRLVPRPDPLPSHWLAGWLLEDHEGLRNIFQLLIYFLIFYEIFSGGLRGSARSVLLLLADAARVPPLVDLQRPDPGGRGHHEVN